MKESNKDIRMALQRRHILFRATRDWFHQEGFMEVDAPVLVPGTGCEPFIDPMETAFMLSAEGEMQKRYLHTSPELYLKRLLARVPEPLFFLGHVFRNGEITSKHLPEFTLMEWYRPHAELEHLITDCEQWISIFLSQSEVHNLGLVPSAKKLLSTRPYEVVSMKNLWQRHANIDLRDTLMRVEEHGDEEMVKAVKKAGFSLRPGADFDDAFFQVMSSAIEPNIGLQRPTVVCDWPRQMAVLAKIDDQEPLFANRFELYAAGFELANAFNELTDSSEQRQRFLADNEKRIRFGKAPLALDEAFLRDLDQIPPTVGIAFGLDRLFQLCFGCASIEKTYALLQK